MQIRGGTRGGQDQFDWEDVKVDKHRENYLGKKIRCVHVPLTTSFCEMARSFSEGFCRKMAEGQRSDMVKCVIHKIRKLISRPPLIGTPKSPKLLATRKD